MRHAACQCGSPSKVSRSSSSALRARNVALLFHHSWAVGGRQHRNQQLGRALRDDLALSPLRRHAHGVIADDASGKGAFTFLFTDVEGSTRTWERDPDAMEGWLANHDRILIETITTCGGHVFKHTGDGLCAVFAAAGPAARAARDIQHAVASAAPETLGPLRVRVAVHTGEARERAGDFY